MNELNEDQLRNRQAAIRDDQRARIDDIHEAIHELLRDEERVILGSLPPAAATERRLRVLEAINVTLHKFMRSYDCAVLIHEATAVLRGDDPAKVAGTLWPVRTERPAVGAETTTEAE